MRLISMSVFLEIYDLKNVMIVVSIIHQMSEPNKNPANKTSMSFDRSTVVLTSKVANNADNGISVIGFDKVSAQVDTYMFKRRVAVGCVCADEISRLKVTMPK